MADNIWNVHCFKRQQNQISKWILKRNNFMTGNINVSKLKLGVIKSTATN